MAYDPITITDYVNPVNCVMNKQYFNVNRNDFNSTKESLNKKNKTTTTSTNKEIIDKFSANDYIDHKPIFQPGMKFKSKSQKEREEERNRENKNGIKINSYVENLLEEKHPIYKQIVENEKKNNYSRKNNVIPKPKISLVKEDINNKEDYLYKSNKSRSISNTSNIKVSRAKKKSLDKIEINILDRLYSRKTHFKGAFDFALSVSI